MKKLNANIKNFKSMNEEYKYTNDMTLNNIVTLYHTKAIN